MVKDSDFQAIIGLAHALAEEIISSDLDESSATTLVHLLAGVRAARQLMQKAESLIEQQAVLAAKIAQQSDGVLETGQHWSMKSGNKRKSWDHREIAKAYLKERFEGQLDVPPLDVADAIMEAASITYWRIGALKAFDIEVDDYCTVEPGVRSIIIE